MAAMNSNRKRKSPHNNIVFELNDEDLSPTHSPNPENPVEDEPSPKMQKKSDILGSNLTADENLKTDCDSIMNTSQNEDVKSEIECDEVDCVVVPKEEKGDSQNHITVIDSSSTDMKDLCEKDSLLNSNSDSDIYSLPLSQKEDMCEDKNEEVPGSTDVVDQVTFLKNENESLKKKLLELTEKMAKCICETFEAEGKPLINIQLLDAEAKKKYKRDIMRFFVDKQNLYVKSRGDSFAISVYEKSSKNAERAVSEARSDDSRSSKKKKKKDEVDPDLMFVVDTSPSLSTGNQRSAVRYSTKFKIGEEEKKEEKKLASCFNCDENHNLRDCPHPKNLARITKARNKMRERFQKPVRYHVDEEQKYAHLKPGQISSALREALGLNLNELPPYIYRMRVLGYPPGWLEYAEESNSQLTLFDSHGNNVHDKVSTLRHINTDKIIEYPGFNKPVPQHCRDYHQRYGCPPFSRQHSIEIMIDNLKESNAKLEKDNHDICDMDLSTDDPSVLEITEKEEDNSQSSEMSLSDLERQKNELLAELTENESTPTSKPEIEEKLVMTKARKALNDSVINLDDSQSESPKTIKDSSFGTPILKSASKFSRLPHLDNFTYNVSPVINFENLPNATGKYEQMTSVLAKVRSALRKTEDKTS